MDSELL